MLPITLCRIATCPEDNTRFQQLKTPGMIQQSKRIQPRLDKTRGETPIKGEMKNTGGSSQGKMKAKML
jgi:hypothetical protein